MIKFAESLNRLPLGSQLYRLQTRAQLLAQSQQVERLYELLTDYDFIAAKASHPEIKLQELIEDYDRAFEPPVLMAGEKAETLKLIRDALRLSADILEKDKKQLAGQLLGRLMLCKAPEIQALLGMVKQQKGTWLRPLTSSLTPPGGRLIRTLSGHSDSVTALALSADGSVISASWDNTLKVWNLETGSEVFTLSGHSFWVTAVALSADGSVISASNDRTLKVWNLETGEIIVSFAGEHPFLCCTVALDKRTIVAGDASGRVHFLRMEGF